MSFQEGVNIFLYLLLALALILAVIEFYNYFRPGVEGGWFASLGSALKWLINPPV